MAGLLSNHEEGKQVGRGRRSRGPRGGNDDHVDELNGQENNQGVGDNGGIEGVNGNVGGVNGGGVVVLTRWIEKIESVQVMSGCSIDQKVKYTACSFVGKALTWWNSQIRILSREVAVSMSWNDFKVGHAAYTDRFHELARNGSIKMVEKRGNMDEPSMDKNDRDDNKRTRIGNSFATTANPVRRVNTSAWPKCTTYNSYHPHTGPCHTCFNCNHLGHLENRCRDVPRNANPINPKNPTVRACYKCGSTDQFRTACPRLNRAQGPGEDRPNQVVANNEGQSRGNLENQARGRAFMIGAEEAR
nr:hypothetical protein [Tanacetum cinerariifolium]